MNVLRMVRVLCDAGYEVHIATYPIGETVPIPGLTYHRARRMPGIGHVPIGFSGRKVLLDVALALKVWHLQLTMRFDLVHAVEESIFLALPLAAVQRTPLIYDIDSVLSDQLHYSRAVRSRAVLGAVRALERAALRRSAAAITVCAALSDAVSALEPEARVVQIEDCPLSESAQAPDPVALEALRAGLGLADAPVAVYVGNFEPYQGVDLLLSAWRQVRARMPNARLLIAGGDARDLRLLRASVHDLSADQSVDESVLAIGRQPPERLPELLAMADVLVSPRRLGENTPLKLYSYMASGVPIVATNLRTHLQVLDATTAVLTAPEPGALADALVAVLSNPARFRSIGEAARARVNTRYSQREFARKLLAAYERVLAPDTSPVVQ